ncbi:MAG: hypothetical protein KatS3mg005_0387 [Bryobacteraceae bacterium]|nr:MAG: hypothetical protein KatS3mg005_0387 [Bryobacteraceae bacterium]
MPLRDTSTGENRGSGFWSASADGPSLARRAPSSGFPLGPGRGLHPNRACLRRQNARFQPWPAAPRPAGFPSALAEGCIPTVPACAAGTRGSSLARRAPSSGFPLGPGRGLHPNRACLRRQNARFQPWPAAPRPAGFPSALAEGCIPTVLACAAGTRGSSRGPPRRVQPVSPRPWPRAASQPCLPAPSERAVPAVARRAASSRFPLGPGRGLHPNRACLVRGSRRFPRGPRPARDFRGSRLPPPAGPSKKGALRDAPLNIRLKQTALRQQDGEVRQAPPRLTSSSPRSSLRPSSRRSSSPPSSLRPSSPRPSSERLSSERLSSERPSWAQPSSPPS